MCRESGLLLLASALSSSLPLPPSRGGVLSTASLRGACGDRQVVVWGRRGLRMSSGSSLGVSTCSGLSFAGSGAPRFMSSSLSSVQQAFPQTMASCVRKGKCSGCCRQLACHTMLHRVHSVSVPPVYCTVVQSSCTVYSSSSISTVP
jgi:hypothetical protein